MRCQVAACAGLLLGGEVLASFAALADQLRALRLVSDHFSSTVSLEKEMDAFLVGRVHDSYKDLMDLLGYKGW